MGYDTTMHRDMLCDITPDHLQTPGKHNSTKTYHLVVVCSYFCRLCLRPHLGLSSVWNFSSSFCCPSTGHIIGLTVPENNNLVPSGLILLPERVMFVIHSSFILFLLFTRSQIDHWKKLDLQPKPGMSRTAILHSPGTGHRPHNLPSVHHVAAA